MARKKRRSARSNLHEYYVIEIADWDWAFSFGVEATKIFEGPYSEYRHLQIDGRVLRPQKLKAEAASLTFLPSIDHNEENRKTHKPTSVGSLSVNKDVLQGLITIPADALTQVLQMLIAGRFRFVVIDGTAMRYRRAEIRHYRMKTAYSDEDLPPDT